MDSVDVLLQVKERLSIFNKLYDVIRLVNPIDAKVINHKCEELEGKDGFCYDIWKRNEKCDNCISKLAYERDETSIKIEYSNGRIMLVIASPIVISEHKCIVEMIKDVSHSGIVANIDDSYEESVLDFLNAIKERTVKDQLTGVYNKFYINERLPKDLKNSSMKNLCTSIVMIDLDDFKSINDTYGHIIGDKVLKEFAEVIEKHVRHDFLDWIGRYGGEEFILVLNHINKEDAFEIAEKIRKSVEIHSFKYNSIKLNLTCSLGVYTCKVNEFNMEEIIDKADRNLYKAKHNGKNMVVI